MIAPLSLLKKHFSHNPRTHTALSLSQPLPPTNPQNPHSQGLFHLLHLTSSSPPSSPSRPFSICSASPTSSGGWGYLNKLLLHMNKAQVFNIIIFIPFFTCNPKSKPSSSPSSAPGVGFGGGTWGSIWVCESGSIWVWDSGSIWMWVWGLGLIWMRFDLWGWVSSFGVSGFHVLGFHLLRERVRDRGSYSLVYPL